MKLLHRSLYNLIAASNNFLSSLMVSSRIILASWCLSKSNGVLLILFFEFL